MTTIDVERMAIVDLEEIHALEAEHQPRPWSLSLFENEVSAPNRHYLVARGGDRLIGFVGAMVVGDEAHVMNLLIDPRWRRRGVAGSLFRALVEGVVSEGAKHVTLEVRSRNRAAIAFYAAQGLAPVGIRPGYYDDDDALIMWAHDIDIAFQQGVGS